LWMPSNNNGRPFLTMTDRRKFPFLDTIDQPGGIVKAAQLLADTLRHDPKAVLFSEVMINRLGYERLSLGDMKSSIEILKLNVTAFPNSPNTYDSLSDAYLFDGQKELALQNAKKALELIPSDTKDSVERRNGIKENAEQKVKQLGGGQQE
jgi:tetratricopeptide (TPR) repeat protein